MLDIIIDILTLVAGLIVWCFLAGIIPLCLESSSLHSKAPEIGIFIATLIVGITVIKMLSRKRN